MKGIVFFILMNIGFGLFAQTSTISDGFWNTAGNWSAGVPGDEVATISNNMIMNISIVIGTGGVYTSTGTITDLPGGATYGLTLTNDAIFDISGNMTIEGNVTLRNSCNLIIRNNDTLRVGNNFLIEQTGVLTIEPLGVLIVGNDMIMRNSSTSAIDGKISVGNDFTASNSASMAGSGNLEVGGETNINNSGNVFGSTSGCSPGPCEYGSGAGLPISLIEFNAIAYNSKNLQIDWTTNSEVNNEHFKIEISKNRNEFELLAEISGAGNSTDLLKYSIVRENPFSNENIVYVRLTQVDYNGDSKTFNPVAVNLNNIDGFSSIDKNQLHLYPNPTDGSNLTLKASDLNAGTYTLEIIDLNGRRIYQNEIDLPEQRADFKYNVLEQQNLNPGFYILRFKGTNVDLSERFVVQ